MWPKVTGNCLKFLFIFMDRHVGPAPQSLNTGPLVLVTLWQSLFLKKKENL